MPDGLGVVIVGWSMAMAWVADSSFRYAQLRLTFAWGVDVQGHPDPTTSTSCQALECRSLMVCDVVYYILYGRRALRLRHTGGPTRTTRRNCPGNQPPDIRWIHPFMYLMIHPASLTSHDARQRLSHPSTDRVVSQISPQASLGLATDPPSRHRADCIA